MMRPLFIVTSAVESRYGIYSPEQRIEQTLETISGLRERVPGCKIAMSEVSGNGLRQEYEDRLMDAVDLYFDFTNNTEVRGIYNRPEWIPNWDIVKNLTELTTFPQVLSQLAQGGELGDVDRVFKMSGRYLLNDKFDIGFYARPDVQNKVVIGRAVPSQFPFEVVQLRMQYMCRLLSWHPSMQADMIGWYLAGRDYMRNRLAVGGYADIEHCLYYGIPRESVYEVDEVGVHGNIAPNGAPIRN